MFAERLIAKTDFKGRLNELPELPPNSKFEIIFLRIESGHNARGTVSRRPHPEICGKLKILGDIINTVSDKAWDFHR